MGIADAKISEVAQYESSAWYSESERAALALAEAVTETPQAIADTVFARARAVFDEDELVELIALAAWENCVCRFNRAVGVHPIGAWEGTVPEPD